MKKLLLVMSLVCLSTVAYSQEKEGKDKDVEVPSVVEKAFMKAYPNTKAKWEKEDGKYEAGFKYKGEEMSILYNANGVWEEKETEIKVAQLPTMALSYVSKKQLGKIKEASKITKADGSVIYEAEVASGDVLFDAKGNFMKLQKD